MTTYINVHRVVKEIPERLVPLERQELMLVVLGLGIENYTDLHYSYRVFLVILELLDLQAHPDRM